MRREKGEDFVDGIAIGLSLCGDILRLVEVFFEASGDEAVIAGGPSTAVPGNGVIGGVEKSDFISEEASVGISVGRGGGIGSDDGIGWRRRLVVAGSRGCVDLPQNRKSKSKGEEGGFHGMGRLELEVRVV